MAEQDVFEGWAILELMGHRRLAGYVREVELAGQGMFRLDVPASEHGDATCEECGANHVDGCICTPALGPVAVTQFYSPAALYCLTPTTEDVARKLAASSRPKPVTRWELEPPPAPPVYVPVPESADELTDEDLVGDDDDGLPF